MVESRHALPALLLPDSVKVRGGTKRCYACVRPLRKLRKDVIPRYLRPPGASDGLPFLAPLDERASWQVHFYSSF